MVLLDSLVWLHSTVLMERSPQYIQHLEAAKICIRREQYGNAIAHFVFLAHVAPSLKPVFEEDFSMALRHWTELLESHGELEKLFVCLEESLKLYPKNVVILNNTGATLLRLGCTDKAASCFRRALRVDPGNIRAKENLENVANLLVERWHFRMLNDKNRNASYKQAISKAIAKGNDVVLDIGSGTGILSMFAVQSGAKEVYACEMSKTMYEMAQDVLKANSMESAVHMVHKKSTELKMGDDIPHRVSLVITETLDCGLLGEGIISTLKHAWNELLVPFAPHSTNVISKVIPEGAIIYAMVVMCKEIRNQTYCKPSVCGLQMFPTSIIGGERMLQKAENRPLARNFDQLEPYSTECLKSLRSGFTPLSHPVKVIEYNFNDPASLHTDKYLMIDIPSTEAGQVDAIVVWFDLHLDEEITLSTGPEGGSLCWEQAVFPVYSPHQDTNKASNRSQVAKGDVISVAGQLTQDCLRMEFLGIKTQIAGNRSGKGEVQQESLTEATAHSSLTEDITVVPPSYMRRLNDEVYNDMYSDVISEAVKRLKHLSTLDSINNAGNCKKSKKFHECNILDVTYGPALSAIFAAREEVDCVLIANPYDTTWIKRILNGNSLPSVIKYGPRKLEEIIKDQRTWSVLISDIVEPCGVIRQQVVEDIVFSRGCLLREDPGFQIIPLGFTVHCMCIQSPFLLANCHILSEDNTLGLNIGQFMNKFQVETHVDVDLTTLDFLAVSDQVELFSFDFMQTFDSDCQMLSLLETRAEHRVQVIKSGTIHALPYWFTLHMDSSNSISTYSEAYPGSHWKQAVIVLKEKVPVIAGQEILISASCINSGISIRVKAIEE